MDIQQEIEKLEKAQSDITKQIESLKFKNKENNVDTKRYRAENYKQYWFVRDSGSIGCDLDGGESLHTHRYNVGNYYETKEQAERSNIKTLAVRKVKDKIRELNDGEAVDWSDESQEKYQIWYEHTAKKFTTGAHQSAQFGDKDLTCKTKEVAKTLLGYFKDDQETLKLAYGVV